MRRLYGVMLAVLVTITACSDTEGGEDTSITPSTPPSQSVISPPTSAYMHLKPVSTASHCSVIGDLEGRFTSAQMSQYLDCIIPDIDQWIDVVYRGMPHPKGYFFVPSGVSDVLATPEGDCPLSDEVLQYCGATDQIFLGQTAVWQQYSLYGDAAPPVVVAHELGHHLQRMAGMTMAMGNAQIRYENQADCVAGAYMAWAHGRGMMSKSDIKDLSASLVDASDADGPGRDHGTESERLQAFDSSYANVGNFQSPLQNCVKYVPEHPIVK